jgi:hypothetical protein
MLHPLLLLLLLLLLLPSAALCFLLPPLHTESCPRLLLTLLRCMPCPPAEHPLIKAINKMKPPKWLFRMVACLVLAGQVISRMCKGGHWHLAALHALQHRQQAGRPHAGSTPLRPQQP